MNRRISLNGSDWLFKEFYGEDWRWRGSHLLDSGDRRHWRVGSVPGYHQFRKKTCSVFRGNIGAEFDAMLEALGLEFAVIVLGFPRAGAGAFEVNYQRAIATLAPHASAGESKRRGTYRDQH